MERPRLSSARAWPPSSELKTDLVHTCQQLSSQSRQALEWGHLGCLLWALTRAQALAAPLEASKIRVCVQECHKAEPAYGSGYKRARLESQHGLGTASIEGTKARFDSQLAGLQVMLATGLRQAPVGEAMASPGDEAEERTQGASTEANASIPVVSAQKMFGLCTSIVVPKFLKYLGDRGLGGRLLSALERMLDTDTLFAQDQLKTLQKLQQRVRTATQGASCSQRIPGKKEAFRTPAEECDKLVRMIQKVEAGLRHLPGNPKRPAPEVCGGALESHPSGKCKGGLHTTAAVNLGCVLFGPPPMLHRERPLRASWGRLARADY